MKRLVIVGNGFDLGHKMKTNFVDFINSNYEVLYGKYKELKNGTDSWGEIETNYKNILNALMLKYVDTFFVDDEVVKITQENGVNDYGEIDYWGEDRGIFNKAISEITCWVSLLEDFEKDFLLYLNTNYNDMYMVTLGKEKYVYALTAVKLVLCLLVDTFMVSTLPVSLNLGVNGIAFSNIIVNVILVATAIILLSKEGIALFKKEKLSFGWMKDFAKVGGISGLESFVRNIAYMLMIARMVNMVGEQGTYWVANNFIWGWLLLPVLQLGELIKRETATDENAVKNNSLGYFVITLAICVLWCITIPLWKPFMEHVLNFSDVDKLFELVMVLLGFYMLYAFQNVFDSTFYGLGKTYYMLFESVVTNTLYYGTAFILYLCGVWEPSLIGIALLFGIGNAFDAIVSLVAYAYLLKKKKINILDIE